MTKYMSINGADFEIRKSKFTAMCISNLIADNNLKTLDQCYEKPSQTKREIYADWMKWYEETPNVKPFGIRSYNIFQFTLCGLYHDPFTDEITGLIEITQTRNTLYVL